MDAIDATKKYCDTRAHRDKCWRPCPVVLIAMNEKEANNGKNI